MLRKTKKFCRNFSLILLLGAPFNAGKKAAAEFILGYLKPRSLSEEKVLSLHQMRIEHARELLGTQLSSSRKFGPTMEHILTEETLVPWVHNALPKKWKNQSVQITRALLKVSHENNLDPIFVMAVVKTESSFNPEARGTSGEIGLMQVLPQTASYVASKEENTWYGPGTLRNPAKNIEIGAKYFSYLREKFSGHARLYLSAYNMGPTNVKRALKKSIIPKEYAKRIMNHYLNMYSDLAAITGSNDRTLASQY